MPEIPTDHPSLWALCLALAAVIAWFIRDANSRINRNIDAKASKDELETLRIRMEKQADDWRVDRQNDQNRSQDELRRMEAQYEQKFAGAVHDFRGQINDVRSQLTLMETHMKERMDLILKFLQKE